MDVNIPKSVPRKLAKIVEAWDDERSYGNSLIVSLHPGNCWRFDPGCHVAGFDTVKEAVEALKEVENCECSVCLQSPFMLRKDGK
jgi:hypothetical protein